MQDIEVCRKIDKLLNKLGSTQAVDSINHKDVPNAAIYYTDRNTQAAKVHINYEDIDKTLSDYQLLSRLNSDKEFVLYL